MTARAARAAQAREVYLKHGVSLRVHLSRDEALTVTRVREAGLAERTWLVDGEEKFETRVLTPDAREDTSEADAMFESRAVAVVRSMATVMKSPGHDGVRLEGLWLESGTSIEALGNSQGFRGTQSAEQWACMLAIRTAGADADHLGWFEAEGNGLLPPDPPGLAAEAAGRVAASRNGSHRKGSPGRVLVDGALARQVLRAIGALFTATEESVGRVSAGLRVAGPEVSVRRAGAHERFDGEGVPRTQVILVEGGRARGVLTDRRLAGRFGLPLTGSATRASFRDYPAVAAPRDLEIRMVGKGFGGETADPLAQVPGRVTYLTEGRVLLAESGGRGLIQGRGFELQDGRVARPVSRCVLPGGPGEWLQNLTGAWDRGKTLLIDS